MTGFSGLSRRLAGPSTAMGIVYLLVTSFGWALNWPLMKFLLRDWPPMFSRGVGGVVAALALAAIARLSGQSLSVPRDAIPRLLFASFTNVVAWMGFATFSMKWISVGEGILLVFTMPIWAMLFAWPLLGERPTLKSLVALALGFAGVVVILGAQPARHDGETLGIVLALGSAVFFALGNVVNRKPLPLPPIASTAWQVGLGCTPMVVVGIVFEHPDYGGLSTAGAWALAYMTVFSMGICYLAWFATLRRLSPTAASTGTLLVPLLGVSFAAVLLGEPFGPRQMIAMALTFSGVAFALQKSRAATGRGLRSVA